VRAAVIVDPFPAFVFPEESVKRIAVPVQLWSSDPALKADGLSGCCAAAIKQWLPALDYHFEANAKHFSFLATCTPKEAQGNPAICTDAPGFDRVDFHRRLHTEMVEFFRKHLVEGQ